jgi:uncharacterized membrane protein HdeD (DUF308 family)
LTCPNPFRFSAAGFVPAKITVVTMIAIVGPRDIGAAAERLRKVRCFSLTLAGVPAHDALATLAYREISHWLPIRRPLISAGERCGISARGQRALRFAVTAAGRQSSGTHRPGGSSMDSIVERAGQLAETDLKRVRWALGINGVLSIALAVVILIWPDISLFALAIVFGAFTAANGVVGLIAAIRGPAISGRGWLVLSSLISIAFGVFVLVRTDMSALALLYVVGAYAITLGIVTIGGGVWLPLSGDDRALLTLTGIVSVLFGIVMFAKPGDGALVLLALIAAYELVKGVSELVVSIGWKRLLERDLKSAYESARAKPQTAS